MIQKWIPKGHVLIQDFLLRKKFMSVSNFYILRPWNFKSAWVTIHVLRFSRIALEDQSIFCLCLLCVESFWDFTLISLCDKKDLAFLCNGCMGAKWHFTNLQYLITKFARGDSSSHLTLKSDRYIWKRWSTTFEIITSWFVPAVMYL